MDSTLSERLKEAMKGPPKVTGRALADACGVKPSSVSDWLSGKSKSMEGSNLIAASEFLSVRPKWLAEGLGPMRFVSTYDQEPLRASENVAAFPKPATDPLSIELLDLFSQLDQPSKIEYLAHLRGFLAGRRPHSYGKASKVAGQ